MATPQGNMIAYQPLKPTELKVGDIYAKHIDQLIKQGEAAKAAELKRKQMEGKALADVLKDIKIDRKSTITPFQDQFNKLTNEGIRYISEAKMKAEDINIPIEERRMYAQRAMNYANDVTELATFFTNPELIKSYQNNLKLVSEGKAFKGDPRIGLFTSADAGFIDIKRNENGNLEIGYIENIDDTPDKKMVYKPLSEVTQMYMTPIQESQLEKYKKRLREIAQKVTEEETNSDGYVKTSNKGFNEEKGRKSLLLDFGYDPNRADEDYNINSVPFEINEFFIDKNKRNISSKEDFLSAINDSLEYMQANADKKTSREILKTAEEIQGQKLENEGKKLRNIKLRQDIAKGNSSSSDDDLSELRKKISVGNVVLNIKSKDNKSVSHYNTKGVSYFAEGGDNKVGVTAYWNPNGEKANVGRVSFAVNARSRDGKNVSIEGVTPEAAKKILAQNKVKDPQNLLALMATMAKEHKVERNPPKLIGKNISKYKFNFSTEKD
ncbi:hypothetical protein PG616_00935 [Riemerella anatipestifer]|nr:hypothetical protein [Riemerella anatipestifer]